MVKDMSSRERMLEAIAGRQADHVPCCFMIFGALRQQCSDQFEFVERQLALGLDATMALPVRSTRRERAASEQGDLYGLPVRFAPQVEVTDWREDKQGERYPILHRRYVTPAGVLHTAVNKTADWVHGERVPLFDDFVIPRARKRLVTGPEDLAPLRHLLTPPSDKDVAAFRETARRARSFAEERGLPVVGEWGVLFDAACWLCGIEELTLMALDDPTFVAELLDVIAAWNRRRMEVILDEGVDVFIRRGWYEHADFLSPGLYRRFILPRLQEDARVVHQAGARLALILTSAYTPLLDMLIESGVDVLMGLDPVQDPRADLALTKRKLTGKICLWGGVNGFLTVERGTPAEVRDAVRNAIEVLAPGGGFILSPVDNVTEDNERVWANVSALIDGWRRWRDYPIRT